METSTNAVMLRTLQIGANPVSLNRLQYVVRMQHPASYPHTHPAALRAPGFWPMKRPAGALGGVDMWITLVRRIPKKSHLNQISKRQFGMFFDYTIYCRQTDEQ